MSKKLTPYQDYLMVTNYSLNKPRVIKSIKLNNSAFGSFVDDLRYKLAKVYELIKRHK